MTLVFSSDHAGFLLKEAVIDLLKKSFNVVNLGVFSDSESSNYAKQGFELAKKVLELKAKQEKVVGIAFCGTGIGISMALNRFKDIRAARISSVEDAILAKKHNNANVIALGGRQIEVKKALEMIQSFLNTQFEGQRHNERIDTLKQKGS